MQFENNCVGATLSSVAAMYNHIIVSVPLVSHKLLKTKRWYVERKCKSTISRFLIGQNMKKWLCLRDVRDLLT